MLSVSVCGHTYGDSHVILPKPAVKCSKTSQDTKRTTTYIAEVSAYTASDDECGNSRGITASGTRVTAGRTLAAPKWIPFGTKVIINGHEYRVEDRGSYVKGNRLDIYMETKHEAFKFGRRKLKVIIVWQK